MTRLTLLCHAATAATRAARFAADEPLDQEGTAETILLAGTPGFTAMLARSTRRIASPTLRARQTLAVLGRDFAEDATLRDWDCGRWTGESLTTISAAEPAAAAAWLTDPAAAPHGGESLLDVLARVERWLALEAQRGGRPFVVTHAAILRAVVVGVLASGPPSFWRIEAPPLCRADVTHDGRRWTLHRLEPA